MSSANIIPINRTAPAGFGARVGRNYPAPDARGVSLGLQPPSQKVQSFDAFTNMPARMGFGTPSLTEATQYNMVRWTYDYWLMITLYRNHWISRKIVDGPAQDMVRAWPRLTSDIDPEDITRIDRVIRKTRVKSQILDTLKWARLFGGAGALMVIKGHENRLDEPLDYDTIELGAFKGLIPFDRWSGIQPEGVVSSDIEEPLLFNLPEEYRVQTPEGGGSFAVHSSRILRFTGPSVPAPEYQAQQYWGISVLEPAYEEIRKRDNMSWNMLSLSFRASIIGMKFDDLAQMLSGAGMNQNALVRFQARMESVNQLMSNNSMLLLPKDGGLEQISVQAAGWSDLYQQFQLDIAGAANYPVTRLFGRTLSGLGQSNDADERIYEELIALEQDDRMRPQLDRLYPVLCMSELGEIPDDLDLTFPSVRVLTEEEKADLGSKMVSNVVALVNAGIMTKAQAMKEIKQSSDVTGFGTNYTDEDIDEAEKSEDLMGELALQPDRIGAGALPEGAVPEGEEAEASASKPGEKQEVPARRRIIRPQSEGSEKSPARDAFPNISRLTKAAKAFDGIDPQFGKRHAEFDYCGIPVAVEYQQGTRRQIRNPQGQLVYDKLLKYDYGFIRNTVGRDGDEIDVILGPTMAAPMVYVVDMEDLGYDVDQREDEDKVLLGFVSAEEAERAFLSMYPETFLRGMVEIPLADFQNAIAATSQFDSEYGAAVALDAEAEDWAEAEHPRGQPENSGQFSSKPGAKGIKGGSKLSTKGVVKTGTRAKGRGFEGEAVKTVAPKYDLKKFRAPSKDDKIPATWRRSNTWVNPDEDGDVVRVGEIIDSDNTMVTYSKAFNERVKAFRQKSWPDWALEPSIKAANGKLKSLADLVPAGATDTVLAKDLGGSILAKFTDTTGNPKSLQNPEHKKANAKEKYKNNNSNIARLPVIKSTINRDLESNDEVTRHKALAAALMLVTGARVGSDSSKKKAPKNWFDQELKRVVPRKKPADYKGLETLVTSEDKFADLKDQYAYVRSNMNQQEIDQELSRLVKQKKITQDQMDMANHHLDFDLGKYQWPKWACELDKKELPEFGAGGLLDIRAENVQEENGKLYLRFIGKESVANQYEISDPTIKKALLDLKQEVVLKEKKWNPAGYMLTMEGVDYGGVTRYNRERLKIKGAPNKSFRTMAACIKAAEIAPTLPMPTTKKELKRNELLVGRAVAKQLNNTPGMAISSYVDPAILKKWRDAVQT